jgi:hypothetical protein
MPKLKLNLTRRWVRSRPGSVLILVIALLVLLALIGTAYLSSTQTERYSSVQNSINTEADLLMQGMQAAVNAEIAGGLYSSAGGFRAPQQEQPNATATTGYPNPPFNGYCNYDSTAVDPALVTAGVTNNLSVPNPPDLFLAERLPVLSTAISAPVWNSVSWPLFADSGGNYTFESPYGDSLAVGSALQKGNLVAIPTSIALPATSGTSALFPAMQFYVPAGKTFTPPAGYAITGPAYVSSTSIVNPVITGNNAIIAADADGDGIADAGLFKLPVGQVDGVTYYGAIRVIDNNSAVNASTAWLSTFDPIMPTAAGDPANMGDVTLTTSTTYQTRNYGFFRSGVGLRELLNTPPIGSPWTVNSEMDNLNNYRFTGITAVSYTPAPPAIGISPTVAPLDDTGTAHPDFNWYSGGDALEQQLARRGANPGYNYRLPGQSPTSYNWFGESQSSALAYKFALLNPSMSQSLIEQILPNETRLYTGARNSPYSPSQVYNFSASSGYWFNDLFNFSTSGSNTMPLRTVLTGTSPVSNGVPAQLGMGNTASSTVAVWNAATQYSFGDWVVNTKSIAHPTGDGYTYVCILPPTPGIAPETAVITDEYWARVPWTQNPVKASINTASFEQLYLNFCQVMTDTTVAAAVGQPKQWLPPMLTQAQQTVYVEKQLPMFRSSIRDNRSVPIDNTGNTGNLKSPTSINRIQLTPMQEMQIRAALAAINTITMRNAVSATANHQVRSRRIVLEDNAGLPAYDVEVFGTDIQPYIGQVYAYVKDPPGTSPSQNFICIQLVNPYPVAIPVTSSWGLATIDRTRMSTLTGNQPNGLILTSVLTPAPSTQMPAFTIPAAQSDGTPGIAVLYDGPTPGNFTLPTPSVGGPGTPAVYVQTPLPGLIQAIGKELVLLKPRLLSGAASYKVSSTADDDTYNEADSTGKAQLFDLVPVDQIDLTGTDTVTSPPSYLYYRRGADSSSFAGAAPHTPPVTFPTNANFSWNFVWPGFYTPTTTVGSITYRPNASPVGTYPFNQAIVKNTTPPTAAPAANPDFSKLCSGSADTSATSPTAPTYDTISLQLNNIGFPGPNPVQAVSGNSFPFGGFARNADMLQIPYIGAYRIKEHGAVLNSSTQGFVEMNSVTMDSSLANDSTLQPSPALTTAYSSRVLPSTAGSAAEGSPTADAVTDPFVEQIGHFCPIGDTSPLTYSPGTALDNKKLLDFGSDNTQWHYHWTKKLFDYFTVQAPSDDYFPNVDPAAADTSASPTAIPAKYPPGAVSGSNVLAVNNSQHYPVSSSFANANVAGTSEDTTGVEGLVNINTAPWPVLAALPFAPAKFQFILYDQTTGLVTRVIPPALKSIARSDNIDIAMAIADYRALHGPFKSIMDLYNVPAVRLENDVLLGAAGGIPDPDPSNTNKFTAGLTAPGTALGYFALQNLTAPGGVIPPAPNGVRYDFYERFLLLNNVSNLITTRSDTFTCYLLLQGWRNVGTANPTMVIQRRIAFIADRSGNTPSSTYVPNYNVPGD